MKFPALTALFLFPCIHAQTMEQEATAFINSLPPNIQHNQERAVRQATAGNTVMLDNVRASRNTAAKLPDNVTTTDIDGKYRLYVPLDKTEHPLPLLIYLHGGGWCFGSINSCAQFCGELAASGGIAVMAVEYPLAPEHPYPCALDFCSEAVSFAFNTADRYGFDPRRISIGGDSAGGNLALATALKNTATQEIADTASTTLPQPVLQSLVLFYPVVKVWNDNTVSWKEYGSGFGLDSSIMEAFNEAYLGDAAPENPLISPICATDGQLSQLPPVLLINADHDILRDQGEELAARLAMAGVAVDRRVLKGTTHLFITVAGQPTAFRESVNATAEFLRKNTTRRRHIPSDIDTD